MSQGADAAGRLERRGAFLRELRERNYSSGYTILKDWLHPQREQAESVAVERFETPPGKQAQVDWGISADSGRTTAHHAGHSQLDGHRCPPGRPVGERVEEGAVLCRLPARSDERRGRCRRRRYPSSPVRWEDFQPAKCGIFNRR